MSVQRQMALAQLDSQAFALMSRLHVILRRECGRITDVEYMRIDPAYCKHVLDLAQGMPNEALPELCARLQAVFFGAEGLFNAKPSKPPLMAAEPIDSATPARPERSADAGQAYVGRLR